MTKASKEPCATITPSDKRKKNKHSAATSQNKNNEVSCSFQSRTTWFLDANRWRAYSRRQGESVTRGDRRRRELKLENSSPPLARLRESTARSHFKSSAEWRLVLCQALISQAQTYRKRLLIRDYAVHKQFGFLSAEAADFRR